MSRERHAIPSKKDLKDREESQKTFEDKHMVRDDDGTLPTKPHVAGDHPAQNVAGNMGNHPGHLKNSNTGRPVDPAHKNRLSQFDKTDKTKHKKRG
jgi:hypothetical protein